MVPYCFVLTAHPLLRSGLSISCRPVQEEVEFRQGRRASIPMCVWPFSLPLNLASPH